MGLVTYAYEYPNFNTIHFEPSFFDGGVFSYVAKDIGIIKKIIKSDYSQEALRGSLAAFLGGPVIAIESILSIPVSLIHALFLGMAALFFRDSEYLENAGKRILEGCIFAPLGVVGGVIASGFGAIGLVAFVCFIVIPLLIVCAIENVSEKLGLLIPRIS